MIIHRSARVIDAASLRRRIGDLDLTCCDDRGSHWWAHRCAVTRHCDGEHEVLSLNMRHLPEARQHGLMGDRGYGHTFRLWQVSGWPVPVGHGLPGGRS
jgi:hypothetical protein